LPEETGPSRPPSRKSKAVPCGTAADRDGGDTDFYAAQTLQQFRSHTDVNYTHVCQDQREALDHGQEFYDNSRKRIWSFDGLDIANDHLKVDDHKESGIGDRGVLRAQFKYRPTRD
jgi:hypothetical protein